MAHWTNKVSECIASFPQRSDGGRGSDSGPVAVKGGSENGLFCIVADVKQSKVTYHTDGRLQVDAIILEVQGQKVAGYTQKDVVAWIRKVCHNGAPVMFKTVLPFGALVVDLRAYLSARFQKGSPDHDLQLTIRDNLYQRTVPCTTRRPRPGEVDGADYTFLTIKEFTELERSGGLLESGLFDGNYYGTPKPSVDNHGSPAKRNANGGGPVGQQPPAGGRSAEERRRRNRSSLEATAGYDDNFSPTTTTGAAEPQVVVAQYAAGSKTKEAAMRTHSNTSAGRGSIQQPPPQEAAAAGRIADDDSDGIVSGDDGVTPARNSGRAPPSRTPSHKSNGRTTSAEASDWTSDRQHGGESNDDDDENLELPVGWERVVDPKYGTYYIDHVNRTTQYDHPLAATGMARTSAMSPAMSQKSATSREAVQSSRSARASPDSASAGGRQPSMRSSTAASTSKVSQFFTKNPAELRGERLRTSLIKSPRGFGFTIVGSDEPDTEFLQIKHVLSNGPAHQDRVLQTGDVLVALNGKCVLGCTHADVVSLFQSIRPGEKLTLEVCRGYPFSFDPTDPNTEIVTTVAVTKPEPAAHSGATAARGSRGTSSGNSSHSDSGSERASPAPVNGGGRHHPQQPGTGAAAGSRQRSTSRTDPDADSLKDYADELVQDMSQRSRGGAGGGVDREMSVSPSMTTGGGVHREGLPVAAAVGGGGRAATPAPEQLSMQIVRGPEGFGFTIADSVHGQKVKSVLDRARCRHLHEGDILAEIDGISVKQLNHTEVVRVLKSCPLGRETTIVVERGVIGAGKVTRASSNAGGTAGQSAAGSGNKKLTGAPIDQNAATPAALSISISGRGGGIDGTSRGVKASHDADGNDEVGSDGGSGVAPPIPAKSGASSSPTEVTSLPPPLPSSSEASSAQAAAGSKSETQKAAAASSGSADVAATQAAVQGIGDAVRTPVPASQGETAGAVLAGPRQAAPSGAEGSVPSAPANTRQADQQQQQSSALVDPLRQQQQQQLAKPESLYSYPVRQQPWTYEGDLGLALPVRVGGNAGQEHYAGLQYRPIEQGRPAAAGAEAAPRRARTPGPESMSTLDVQPGLVNGSRYRSKTPNPVEDRRMRVAMDRMAAAAAAMGVAAQPSMHGSAVDGSGWPAGGPGSAAHAPPFGGRAAATVPGGAYPGPALYQHVMPIGAAEPAAGVGLNVSAAAPAAVLPIYREQVVELDVTLYRQESGFGFRIVGGPEEGTQVAIGHIVPRGAADLDGRVQTGDEIIAIDGVSTLGESHHRVVQLMGSSASRGKVDMRVRRRMLIQASPPARAPPLASPHAVDATRPYDVTIVRGENEGFGFVIVSSLARPDAPEGGFKIGRINEDSPAMRCGRLRVGDRIVFVNGRSIAGLQHEEIVNIIKDSGFQVTLTVAPPVVYSTAAASDGGLYGTMTSATALPAIGESDTILRMNSTSGGGGPRNPAGAGGAFGPRQAPPFTWRGTAAGGDPNYADNYTDMPAFGGNLSILGAAVAQPSPTVLGGASSSVLQLQQQQQLSAAQAPQPVSSNVAGQQYQQLPRSREGSLAPVGGSSSTYPSSTSGMTASGQVTSDNSGGGGDRGMILTIELPRGLRGFGFSIRGGLEFNNMPLYVLRIADDGPAKLDGRLRVGDELLEINGYRTTGMTHSDAINLIQSGAQVRLLIRRTGRVPSSSDSPQTSPTALVQVKASSPDGQTATMASLRMPDGAAAATAVGRAPPYGPASPGGYKPGAGSGYPLVTIPGPYRTGYEAGMPSGSGNGAGGADFRAQQMGSHVQPGSGSYRPQRPAFDGGGPAAAVRLTGGGGHVPGGVTWAQPPPAGLQPRASALAAPNLRGLYEQAPPARHQLAPSSGQAGSGMNPIYASRGQLAQQQDYGFSGPALAATPASGGAPATIAGTPAWPGARSSSAPSGQPLPAPDQRHLQLHGSRPPLQQQQPQQQEMRRSAAPPSSAHASAYGYRPSGAAQQAVQYPAGDPRFSGTSMHHTVPHLNGPSASGYAYGSNYGSAQQLRGQEVTAAGPPFQQQMSNGPARPSVGYEHSGPGPMPQNWHGQKVHLAPGGASAASLYGSHPHVHASLAPQGSAAIYGGAYGPPQAAQR